MELKLHLYSITSVTSLPNISAIRLGPRPTNCCGLGSVLSFRVLGVALCIYSSSNTKAQILALRFPISHAKAHISLKSRQWGKTLPTSLNSEMEFRKVSQECRDSGAKTPPLLDHSDAKPSSKRHVRESRDSVSNLRC